jgi:AcrR family transcriptional regulator
MPQPSAREPEHMKIADLERVSGVSRSTLHMYLSQGLIPPPLKRGPKLHLYGPAHLAALAELRREQERGLSLADIRAKRARRTARRRASSERAEVARTKPGQRHGSVRTRILDTAARLFTERGYETVHVSDVARAAGVGKATLYEHFKSKSELFLECLDRLTEAMVAQQQRFIADEGASLQRGVEQYAAAAIATFPQYRMMISALGEAAFGSDGELAMRARAAFLRMGTSFAPWLERAMASGRCRPMDADLLAYMSWGALMAVGARLAHGDDKYTMLEALRVYFDFVTHGVAPR